MSFPRRPHTRRSPDDAAAEGLLDRRGAVRGAPAVEQAIARLFEAAAGPATARELSGEAGAVAALVLACRTAGTAAGKPGRRPHSRSFARPVPVLAAGVITAAVLAVGGTAAAGALPAPIQQLAHVAFGAPVPHHPGPHRPATRHPARTAQRTPGSIAQPGRHGTHPGATAKARRGAADPKDQQPGKAKGRQKSAGSKPAEHGNRPANAMTSRSAGRE